MEALGLIEQVTWLQAVSAAAREELAARARVVEWPDGATVCHQDEEDRTCFVLGGGAMRVARALPDGRAVTLAHLAPPAVFGELALLGSTRRTATVTAMGGSSGIALAAEDVLAVLEQDPRASLRVAVDLARRLAIADERVLRYALGTAAGGVSATLLAWVHARRERGGPVRDVEVVGGVGDVARTAGIPKRAAMRFMSHLELEGTITSKGGRTIVHDPDALARYLG